MERPVSELMDRCRQELEEVIITAAEAADRPLARLLRCHQNHLGLIAKQAANVEKRSLRDRNRTARDLAPHGRLGVQVYSLDDQQLLFEGHCPHRATFTDGITRHLSSHVAGAVCCNLPVKTLDHAYTDVHMFAHG